MMYVHTPIPAKPFLKWAGGKTQLLAALTERLPRQIRESGRIEVYVEPFVGGGAFFFHLKSNFTVKRAYLLDINKELILGYRVIQEAPEALIVLLKELEAKYQTLNSQGRKAFYYAIREQYNQQMYHFNYGSFNEDWILRASWLIFLNKTCYNGLFRQNQKGEFNVPHGSYDHPTICDADNIRAVSKALENVTLICDDFLGSKGFIDHGTLVYFDPPYRPLSKTANFTSYSKHTFTDEDQIRLANFYRELDTKGAFLLLSNSDPKASNPDDNFFDDLFAGFNIERVFAKRAINRDPTGRGEITELIIRNYG